MDREVPYINETTICRFLFKTNLEKIVDMINRAYFSVNPRILCTSKPILQRSGKDIMLPEKKVLQSKSLNTTVKLATLDKIPMSKNKNKKGCSEVYYFLYQ